MSKNENLMLKTYENITRINRDGDRPTHAIKGFSFTLTAECENDYYKEVLPTIPAGTTLLAEYACDSGMYAMCEVEGALHKIKIKIKLHDLHKVDFGTFDARNSVAS